MRISPVLLGLVLAACYRYVPSPAARPAIGDDVRLTLSTDATARLAPVLGPRTTRLTGRVLADWEDEFALAVDRTFKEDGVAFVWAGDRVTIPRSGIAQIEGRVLDRRRTFLTTSGALVGAVVSTFVLSKFRAGAGNSGTDPSPPTPP